MNKKFMMLIVSVFLCSSLGLLSAAADTDSAFTLEQSDQITSSTTPKKTEPPSDKEGNQTNKEGLPITGKNVGSLPITGEQLAHILTILGAALVSSLFIFWKNQKKKQEENDENFFQ